MTTSTPSHPDELGTELRQLSVSLPARPDAVADGRRAVREVAAAAGMHPDRVDDLAVAVTEAITNALEAQARRKEQRDLALVVRVDPDVLWVEVTDSGGGFDPSLLPPRPPLADPRHLDVERGWGIRLMRELVDEVRFLPAASGTVARLAMRRDGSR